MDSVGGTRLRLNDVSLVIIDTAYHRLAQMAVEATLQHVDFGDVLLFSNRNFDLPFPTLPCDALSLADAEAFMWYGVLPHLRTSHALYIQWDGWVTCPAAWQANFLDYDWIGAVWPWHRTNRVGNGGFSLRSKRLLQLINDRRSDFPLLRPEDEALCRIYRPSLEECGLRWADETTARNFAHEHEWTGGSFGFHGVWNCVRYLSEDACLQRLALFNSHQIDNQQSAYFIGSAERAGMGRVVDWLLSRRLGLPAI